MVNLTSGVNIWRYNIICNQPLDGASIKNFDKLQHAVNFSYLEYCCSLPINSYF
jgi:hypothetical protein